MALALWVCIDCDWAVVGDADIAHHHHHVEGCWTHWIYEFGENVGGALNRPTGRSIHTSDTGGYYFEDGTPAHVGETFAMAAANRAMSGLRARRPRQTG